MYTYSSRLPLTALVIAFISMSLHDGNTLINRAMLHESVPPDTTLLGHQNLRIIGDLEKRYWDVQQEELHDSGCITWSIDTIQFEGALSPIKAEEVDAQAWNSLCSHLPCFYSGRVIGDEGEFKISINAGSYVTLRQDGVTRYFIFRKPDERFLVPCAWYEWYE